MKLRSLVLAFASLVSAAVAAEMGVNNPRFAGNATGSLNLSGATLTGFTSQTELANALAGKVATGSDAALAGVALPLTWASSTVARLRTYAGGTPDDVLALGFNLSETEYWGAHDLTKPKVWMAIEFDASPNPEFANANTWEWYVRSTLPGNVTSGGYLEPIFFNGDRDNHVILFGHLNANILKLSSSDASTSFMVAGLGGISLNAPPAGFDWTEIPVSIGPLTTPDVSFGVNVANPLLALTALTETNPVRFRAINVGGTVTFGLNGSTTTGIFSGTGDVAYSFGFNNPIGTPINFGHTNVQMSLLGSGNLGVGTLTPQAKLAVTGASGAVSFEVTTGTGANEDAKLQVGVHNSGYSWLQAIKPGNAYHNLILQPEDGDVGIGTTAPGAHVHLKKASGPTFRFEQTGGVVWDLFSNSTSFYLNDSSNGRAPVIAENSGNVLLASSGTGKVGIGEDNPDTLLHLKAASAPTQRFEQIGGTNVWDVLTDGTDFYLTDATNGRAPIILRNDGDVELAATAGTVYTGGAAVVGGVLYAGSSVVALTDSAGKILSAALNTVAIGQGGTGATSASGARSNLGLGALATLNVADVVDDTAYDATTWNGVTTRAPSMNAVRDKIESLSLGGGSGDVTAASSFGNDNRLIRSDGTGKGVQASGVTLNDSDAMSGVTGLTLSDGGEADLYLNKTGTNAQSVYFFNAGSATGVGMIDATNSRLVWLYSPGANTYDYYGGSGTGGGTTIAPFALTAPNSDLTVNNVILSTYLKLGGGAYVLPATNGITLKDISNADFAGLLAIGGTTSSFPALKRNGAGLQVRLADDSGFGALGVSTLTSSVSTGTAPFTVSSTTEVANLHAATATVLHTTRAIYGNNFDGSAALTQIIASTYGGTGNGFFKVTGPASSERTFTFPNADATVLTTNAAVTVAQGGTGIASGTSGGIPYFSGSTTIASSAALAANALVIGGGAGVAPSTTTTGSGILTFLGTPSSANLASALTDETGSGPAVFATNPVINGPTIGTSGTSASSHITTVGSVPSVSATGLGSGGSPGAALDTGSTDMAGTITLTTGNSSVGSTGTVTLTFNGAYVTRMPVIVATLVKGATDWGALATVRVTTESLTAPILTWNNSATGAAAALATGTTYKIHYHVVQK